MTMRTHLLAATAGLAMLIAACGGTDDAGSDVQPDAGAATTAPSPDESAAPTGSPVDVLAGQSDLGPILVGPDGLTLYGFTNDVDAISACYGTCAEAWPPVIVSDDWTAGPGLDFGIFATTVRDDGQRQLVAGRWPLYYFAGDAVPGDVNGQGSGDVWFAVDVDGGLILDDAGGSEAAADDGDGESVETADEDDTAEAAGDGPVSTGTTDIGDVLVDTAGLTLYGFLDDREAGGPTCNDACADAWPPLVVDGSELPDGLDPEVFSLVTRDDGSQQLAAGIWPLYLFAGDAEAGEINGQGSGAVWFAVAPDGSLVGGPGGADADDEDGALGTEAADSDSDY